MQVVTAGCPVGPVTHSPGQHWSPFSGVAQTLRVHQQDVVGKGDQVVLRRAPRGLAAHLWSAILPRGGEELGPAQERPWPSQEKVKASPDTPGSPAGRAGGKALARPWLRFKGTGWADWLQGRCHIWNSSCRRRRRLMEGTKTCRHPPGSVWLLHQPGHELNWDLKGTAIPDTLWSLVRALISALPWGGMAAAAPQPWQEGKVQRAWPCPQSEPLQGLTSPLLTGTLGRACRMGPPAHSFAGGAVAPRSPGWTWLTAHSRTPPEI